MNDPLLKRRYNFYIILFILLSSLLGGRLPAFAGDGGAFAGGVSAGGAFVGGVFAGGGGPLPAGFGPHDLPGRHSPIAGEGLFFTPACPIVAESFNQAVDVNGATSDPGATGWSLNTSAVPNAVVFSVQSHRLKAQTLGGEGVWMSKVFSIAGYTGIQVDAKISSEGTFTSAEYVKVFYKLNGGAETLISAQFGSFGTPTVTSPALTGSTVQIVIRIYNVTVGNSDYYIENYDVFKEKAPCIITTATVAASASNSGVLTCTNPNTTLSATTSATTGTTTYAWTGPNSYTSTSANPVVSTTGTYSVTVTTTSGTTAAIGTGTVAVTSNTTAPAGVTAAVSGSLSCATTGVTLTGASTSTGTTFTWTGPNSFTATGATATATAAGNYTVTAKNPTTGCTTAATVAVSSNTSAPAGVTATVSGPLTCTTSSVTLTGASTTTGVTFAWTGPNSFTATTAAATTSAPGTYTLTVTNPTTGCTATAVTTVAQAITAPAGVTAVNNGPLTCINPSVTLTGASTTTGATFAWSGPNGFTATTATAGAGAPGTYTLTVTNPTSGCTTTAATTVAQSITPPAGVTAINNGPLTCSTASVTLTGASTTTGATFAWSGPNSFTATTARAVTSAPGTYILTVTNPTSGCVATTTTVVAQNIVVPAAVTATNNGPLTCSTNSIILTGSSSTAGTTFAWSGPNSFTATGATVTVSAPGTYTLTVTNPTTGCTAIAATTVAQTITPPAGLTAINNGPLTCSTTSVTLTGSSTTTGTTFAWSGPNSFTVTGATATVSAPGTYTLTATNTGSGCMATTTTVVAQSNAAPLNVAAGNTGPLTCSHSNVLLTASSSTTGVSYSWTGPNSFTASGNVVTVFAPGLYTLTVSNPASGCTVVTSTTVLQDLTSPANVTITPSAATLTCSNPSVLLTGSTSTAGSGLSWSGPNGFTATGTTASAGAPGEYILTVTNPTTGCTTTTAATINQNFTPPAGITAINNGPLTCSMTSVNLTGGSTSSGSTFSWTGPNSFTAATANVTVSTAGTYVLTVTNPSNGCSGTATTVVLTNMAGPAGLAIASLPANAALTCTNSSVSLTASSSLTGASYSWSGPNNFISALSAVNVTLPGTYTVTATNSATGCSSSIAAIVTQNLAPPASLQTVSTPLNATLTCSATSITLTASSAVSGANYIWTGPNSFTSPAATATVNAPGTYVVTATDPSNGCSSTATAVITQNINAPSLKTSANPVNGQITCAHPNVVLTAASATAGIGYSWTGPNGFNASTAAATVTAPGVYTVTATDPGNGCSSTATASATRNINAPVGVTAGTSDVLSCFTPSVFVTGSTTTSGATFSWTGPDGFTASSASAEADKAGTYTLTVTNPANGCTTTASTMVIDNTQPPAGVAATNSGPLNCINTTVTLSGSSTTAGVAYTWVAPDNSLTQGATSAVTAPGIYTLVVTDPTNGCASTATTSVTKNTTGCTGSSVQAADTKSGLSSTFGTGQDTDSAKNGSGLVKFEYKAYPNPSNGQAFITFKSPDNAPVTVEIDNIYGARLQVLFNSAVIANQPYKLEWNAGNLPSGTYFCIIRSNGKIYSSKLILVKQ